MSAVKAIAPERLRTAAECVGREAGLRLVVLFGSASRRDAPAPEDLDLAVLGDRVLDTVALTNRLIRELAVQEIDVTDLRRADPLLLALVARDGTPLFEAEPGAFARFASLAMRRYADTQKFREAERRELRERLGGGPTAR